jgi:hypothetical protein
MASKQQIFLQLLATLKIELLAAVFPCIALNTLVVSTATQTIDLQLSLLAIA